MHPASPHQQPPRHQQDRSGSASSGLSSGPRNNNGPWVRLAAGGRASDFGGVGKPEPRVTRNRTATTNPIHSHAHGITTAWANAMRGTRRARSAAPVAAAVRSAPASTRTRWAGGLGWPGGRRPERVGRSSNSRESARVLALMARPTARPTRPGRGGVGVVLGQAVGDRCARRRRRADAVGRRTRTA